MRVALVVLAALLTAGAAYAQLTPRLVAPLGPASVQEGHILFDDRCASCHGVDLQGSAGVPSLRGVGAAALDFFLSTGRMPASVPSLESPHGPPQFDRKQIDAIIAYVTSRYPGGPPIPRLAPPPPGVDARQVFELNCEACHGVYGQGAVVGYGWVAPPLNAATQTEIAEAVRIGPGMMPRFGPDEIPDAKLDALVRYVVGLHTNTYDPGGWEIGRIGPVAEGFVAWLVGLGTLVGLIRYIGTNE